MKRILFLMVSLFVVGSTACSGGDESHEGHTNHGHVVNENGDIKEVPLEDDEMGSMDHGDDHDMDHDMDSMDMDGIPEDITFESEKASDNGTYQLSLTTASDPLVINEIHTWVVHIEDADGNPVEDATLSLNGGMPEHAHGFPTEPSVGGHISDGNYEIDGVKFQMGGWWQFELAISAEAGADTVSFNVNVPK